MKLRELLQRLEYQTALPDLENHELPIPVK